MSKSKKNQMRIIVSPSKTQDLSKPKSSPVKLLRETQYLFQYIQSLNKPALSKLLKIKNKLLDEVYDIYQNKQQYYQAIDLYAGVVFEQLKLEQYNANQKHYMNTHLRILSAMYGPLKPDDLIYPYRLDMTIKPKKINLYDYWSDIIEAYFEDVDIIVNLASNEFSKIIKKHRKKLLNIHFQEEQDNNVYKVISYNAKKARGILLNQMIINQVMTLEDIKTFVIDGYTFDSQKSNDKNFYFIKKRI